MALTRHSIVGFAAVLALVTPLHAQEAVPAGALDALGTSFTYQGRLADAGTPATGAYDLQFALYDAATTPPGVQIGTTILMDDVTVTDGVFTVELDFSGAAFTGAALYLEIAARPGASLGAFTTLVPRQPLSPAPFAHYSRSGIATDVQCAGCVGVADLAAGAAAAGQVLSATGPSTVDWKTPAWPSGSGDPGQVALWSGPTSLTGSPGLVWDDVNGRLGVGTKTPLDTLDVTGSIRLPETTSSSSGVLRMGGEAILHAFGSHNIFVGRSTGNFTLGGTPGQGDYNTAIGDQTLQYVSTGQSNVAVGHGALIYHFTGSYNVAVGNGTLELSNSSSRNTAVGNVALGSNRTGNDNAAVGSLALRFNDSGSENTAVGESSLKYNTTAGRNTAVGRYALYTQSYDNGDTAWNADNTAVGFYALYSNQPTSTTVGRRNTAVGGAAGDSRTGTNNTFLGYDADATVDLLSNATALGSGARVDASNKVRIGNTSVTVIEGQVDWSFPSDIRHKKDVSELDLGLDLVLRLRPVQYRLIDGNDRLDMGFIAQDVEAILGDGYNVVGVGEDDDRTLSLRRGDLIAPLVKAVQEQQAEIEAQRAIIEEQRAALAELRRRLDTLEASRDRLPR